MLLTGFGGAGACPWKWLGPWKWLEIFVSRGLASPFPYCHCIPGLLGTRQGTGLAQAPKVARGPEVARGQLRYFQVAGN